jgi:hypothetical protein
MEYCQRHRESEKLFIKDGGKKGGSLKKVDLTYAIDIMEMSRLMIIKRSYRQKSKIVLANNLLSMAKGIKRKRGDDGLY